MSRKLESNPSLVIVFDVETTGLIPRELKPGNIPYIIQLSYVLYDISENVIKEQYNNYILLPESISISPVISELTGITRPLLEEKGIDIKDALESFYDAWQKAGIAVAHNMEFDITMLLIESSVHCEPLHKTLSVTDENKTYYCTMEKGTDMCQIKRANSRGVYFKQPKLSELHNFFFGTVPEGLHNSMVDVLTTLRCYMLMRWGKQIDIASV